MKPRRTPLCFFSNASRYSLRNAMIAAHVHLVEGGQHRCVVLRFLQPQRDGPPQPRHFHPLLARLILAGGFGRGRGRRRWSRAVQEVQHIALGDAPILAGPGANITGRDLVFRDHLRRRRQRRMRRVRTQPAGRPDPADAAAGSPQPVDWPRGAAPVRRRDCATRLGACGCHRAIDQTEHGADLDFGPFRARRSRTARRQTAR